MTVQAPEHTTEGLVVESMRVQYGDVVAVEDVSLQVRPGEIVALLGANGAGKSSLLDAISGMVPATSGSVSVDGRSLDKVAAEDRALAIGHVPEGRRLFPEHTVRENLMLAGYTLTRAERTERIAHAERVLPRLEALRRRRGGLLSGGEQQMVALGRGIMAPGRVLVVDELSLGLAPLVARSFADTLRVLRDEGYAILLVEQYITLAMQVADRVVVLDHGKVVLEGTPDEVRSEVEALERAYLGDESAAAADAADSVARVAEVTDPYASSFLARSQPVAAIVISLLMIATGFFPWFKAESFSGETHTIIGWDVPLIWSVVPMLLVAAVGVAGIVRMRTRRPFPVGVGVALSVASAMALLILYVRVWILDNGLPEYTGFTYTRAWGLLVALQVAGPGIIIAAGFLGERIIADRRKFFAPPPSDGPADAGDEHPPVQSDATSEVER